MKTNLSSNCKFKRVFANILSIFVILAIALSVTGIVLAQESSPWLRAFPDQDFVDGSFWPANKHVHLTINDLEFDATANSEGYVEFDLTGYDLVRGDTLTMQSGENLSVTYTVRQLIVNDIDLATQTVSGTVDGPQTVHVWSGGAELYVESDESGNWSADFSGFEDPVLFAGVCGNAEAWGNPDSSSSTIIDWCLPEPPPNPYFAVSLTQHWFMVNNFLPETLVTISVYDSQGSSTPVLEFKRYTDASGNLSIEGWEHTWDLEPDNYVVVTDGTNTKDLLLEYVTLDVFDPENDLILGQAVAGKKVDIGVGNAEGEKWMSVFADQITGEWTADFKPTGFDITEDMWAGAHVNDEDGDVTAAHNSGPSEPPAWFTAFPDQEVVEGWDWPLNSMVHLTIDDPKTDASPDYWQDETVVQQTPWGSYQLWIWFEFPDKYDLKPGDVVTLTDGVTERTHVVRNLSITEADGKHNTVSGTSDSNENINLWSWEDPQGRQFQVTANHSGAWSADFDDIGFDLIPSYHVRAEVWDEGGNDTAVDWYVHPRYTGQWRAVDAYDQSNMHLTISGGGNNQYQLIWTDDYWSACDGRNSVGLGTGRLIPDVLRVDWVIKCQGAVVWEGQIDYWMNLETGELWNGANTWYPVGGK